MITAPNMEYLVMQRMEILKYIRANKGIYGNELPDDDDTLSALSDLVQEGLVRSEPARLDDFFSLTTAGRKACRT